jgi:hypothetical protein
MPASSAGRFELERQLDIMTVAERGIGGLFEITEIPESHFCQPLNREFGGSFIYLFNVWSHLV